MANILPGETIFDAAQRQGINPTDFYVQGTFDGGKGNIGDQILTNPYTRFDSTINFAPRIDPDTGRPGEPTIPVQFRNLFGDGPSYYGGWSSGIEQSAGATAEATGLPYQQNGQTIQPAPNPVPQPGDISGSLPPAPVAPSTLPMTPKVGPNPVTAPGPTPAPGLPGYQLGNNSLIQSGWNQITPTQNTPTPMLNALSAGTSTTPISLTQQLASVQSSMGDPGNNITQSLSPLAALQMNFAKSNTGTKISY